MTVNKNQKGEAQIISEHKEYPIFDKFLNIKQRLMLQNQRDDIKSKDIVLIQQQVEDTILELMVLRQGVLFKRDHINNRTDDELNKVCQLISLCFMTMGHWHQSPAIFCQITAIKNCFYQLEKIGIYNEKILEPYNKKLKQLERILTEDEMNYGLSEPIMELVEYNYSLCKRIYDQLLSTIKDISPELIPIRDQLLDIRNDLVDVVLRDQYNEQDILPIQKKLYDIDSVRGENGIFLTDLSLAGQATLVDILENNFSACHDLLNSEHSPIIESVRKQLIDVKKDLLEIEVASRWSLRQTDLFPYQIQLHDITRMLHEQVQFEEEQGIIMLSYLLSTCYNIILNLMGEGPHIEEILLPVYNQLNTLRDCLKRLKSLNCNLEEDEKMLYLLKLRSIDMMRKDGVFYGGEGIKIEGQSQCVYVLEECYTMIQELSVDTNQDEENEYGGIEKKEEISDESSYESEEEHSEEESEDDSIEESIKDNIDESIDESTAKSIEERVSTIENRNKKA
ncbi:hypothetical protein EDC94DRAFT_292652 [Helicostylum pulchrum]|nr:hypothetical protein EDC94DRAFT_292652 [Helicostylum pulchrum]